MSDPYAVPLTNWSLTIPKYYKATIDAFDFEIQSARQPWSIQAIDASSVRFEVRDNDQHWWDASNGRTAERSELAASGNVIRNGQPVQISYGFMIEPGAPNTASWTVLGQFHQDLGTIGNPTSPPFEIDLEGEKLVVKVRYGTTYQPETKVLFLDLADIQRGHLYDMQISAVFDPAGNGRLVIVRDGITLVEYSGPLGFAEQNGVYWAQGIYRSGNATETLAVQYRDIDIKTDGEVILPNKDAFIGAPLVSVSHVEHQAGTSAATVTLSGTAKLGTTVSFFEAGQLIGTAVVDANGHFEKVVGVSGPGSHGITAVATDGWGRNGVTAAPTKVLFTTAADLVAKLGTLSGEAGLGAIILTDSHVLQLSTQLQLSFAQRSDKDAPALALIEGGYTLVYTQTVSGQSYDRQVLTYASDGRLVETERWSGQKLTFDNVTAPDGSSVLKTWAADGTSSRGSYDATQRMTAYTSYDTAGKVVFDQAFRADGSSTTHFFDTASGTETRVVVISADKSRVETQVNLKGQSYTSQVFKTDASGKLIAQERYTADGNKLLTLYWNPDGSREVHYYSATTGKETSSTFNGADGSRIETTFGVAGKSYAGIANHYDAANRASGQDLYDATGKMIASETWSADGAKTVYAFDRANGTATGYRHTTADKAFTDVVFAVGTKVIAESSAFDATGHLLSKQTFSGGQLATLETWSADGSHVTKFFANAVLQRTNSYDAAGHLVTEAVCNASGTVISQASLLAAGARVVLLTDASTGEVTSRIVTAADGSREETVYGIKGAAFTSEARSFDAAGILSGLSRWAGSTLVQSEAWRPDGSHETHRFDGTTGAETGYTIVHADKSRVEVNLAVVNKFYAVQEMAFDSVGHLTDVVRRYGSETGHVAQKMHYGADGSSQVSSFDVSGNESRMTTAADQANVLIESFDEDGTRTFAEARHPDGSRETHFFNGATGAETGYTITQADKSRVEVKLGITDKFYAAQEMTFDATGRMTDAVRHYDGETGQIAQKMHFNADGSWDMYSYDRAGRETSNIITHADKSSVAVTSTYSGAGMNPVTVYEDHFGTNGQKLWLDTQDVSGTHTITAWTDGLVLTSHKNAADVFNSAGNTLFVFEADSGRDVIRNFQVGGSAAHDRIQLDHDVVSAFEHVQMRDVGANVVIDLGANDSITLMGIHAAQLTVHDFLFV